MWVSSKSSMWPIWPLASAASVDAELEIVREHRRLRLRIQRLQHRQEFADRRMPAAGERAADPVEHAAARFVHRGLGQILEAEARQERREIARDVEAERRRAVVGLGCRLQSHRARLYGMNRPPLTWMVWPVM